MKLRMLALALALGCGLTVAADAKTKNVRHGAPAYKVKKFRNKAAKGHKIRPAVRRSKVKVAKRNH